jgi:hypothetical protein
MTTETAIDARACVLDKYVNDVCAAAAIRLRTPGHLVPRLESLIARADDRGFASAVYWHGCWFSYGDACYMLGRLRSCAANGSGDDE